MLCHPDLLGRGTRNATLVRSREWFDYVRRAAKHDGQVRILRKRLLDSLENHIRSVIPT